MDDTTHRLCERCWFDVPDPATNRPPGEEPDHTYRIPAQVPNAQPGPCCSCAGMTITAIQIFEPLPSAHTLTCANRHDPDATWSHVEPTPAGGHRRRDPLRRTHQPGEAPR